MAPKAGKGGGDYLDFTPFCNSGALMAFKVLEFMPDETIVPKDGGSPSVVNPVMVDVICLDDPSGGQTGRVARREKVIGKGMTGPLRRMAINDDAVYVMQWGKRGATSYPQCNPPTPEQLATANSIFESTGDDPYTAAERAQHQAATASVKAGVSANAPETTTEQIRPAATEQPVAQTTAPAQAEQPANGAGDGGQAVAAKAPWLS